MLLCDVPALCPVLPGFLSDKQQEPSKQRSENKVNENASLSGLHAFHAEQWGALEYISTTGTGAVRMRALHSAGEGCCCQWKQINTCYFLRYGTGNTLLLEQIFVFWCVFWERWRKDRRVKLEMQLSGLSQTELKNDFFSFLLLWHQPAPNRQQYYQAYTKLVCVCVCFKASVIFNIIQTEQPSSIVSLIFWLITVCTFKCLTICIPNGCGLFQSFASPVWVNTTTTTDQQTHRETAVNQTPSLNFSFTGTLWSHLGQSQVNFSKLPHSDIYLSCSAICLTMECY